MSFSADQLDWKVLDLLPDAVFCIDRRSMQFSQVNAAAVAVSGYSVDELVGMGPCPMAASIGVTVGSGADRRVVDLLHDADRAMYRVKTLGGGKLVTHDHEPNCRL